MDLKELAKALGLPETATEEEIKKAVEDAVKAAEKLKEMDGKKPGEGDGKPGDGEPKPEGADMVANSTILSMLGAEGGCQDRGCGSFHHGSEGRSTGYTG